MKDSLGREARWNADRCAPGDPGAAVAESHGRIPIASVGVSPPTFSFFFRSSLPDITVRRTASRSSPVPGNPCRSFAGTALPPALGPRRLDMVTISDTRLPWLGCEAASRERDSIFLGFDKCPAYSKPKKRQNSCGSARGERKLLAG